MIYLSLILSLASFSLSIKTALLERKTRKMLRLLSRKIDKIEIDKTEMAAGHDLNKRLESLQSMKFSPLGINNKLRIIK